MGTRLADLPPGERPRERLWAKGPGALTERELIALILRNGRPGESALDLAAELLAEYGGLSRIATAHPEELASVSGVGPAKAAALIAACQIGRFVAVELPGDIVRGPEDVAAIATRELGTSRREKVLVVVLDTRHRVLRIVSVSEGKANRAQFPVREILNAVLRNDGVAFAVAHNHPSADSTPSPEDDAATAEIDRAARTLGLRFLDHVVIAGEHWASLTAGDSGGFMPRSESHLAGKG